MKLYLMGWPASHDLVTSPLSNHIGLLSLPSFFFTTCTKLLPSSGVLHLLSCAPGHSSATSLNGRLLLISQISAKMSPPSRGLPNHLLQSRSCLGFTPFLILFSSWNFLPSEICFHCLSVYCLKTLFYSGQRLSSWWAHTLSLLLLPYIKWCLTPIPMIKWLI